MAEEIAAQYRAAMARGVEMARAQSGADDTGRHGAEDATQPSAEEGAGRGSVEDTAWSEVGGEGGTGGAASEKPAGQVEKEGPAPKPTEAGGEVAMTTVAT